MILLGLGTAIAIVGLIALADEWRRSGTQHARVNKLGLRFEIAALAALVIGLGVAMAYASVST
jgi:hypothetical protein